MGWSVVKEVPGVKRVSVKAINGVEVRKIEVWSVGKSGKTLLGSPAAGSWKVRGYKAGGKFSPKLAGLGI